VNTRELFFWVMLASAAVIMAFILLPMIQLLTAPSIPMLQKTIRDPEVLRSLWLSIYTSGCAALISFALGTPLAYLLARTRSSVSPYFPLRVETTGSGKSSQRSVSGSWEA
jgi:molybdate/tungstate transport system permease protein